MCTRVVISAVTALLSAATVSAQEEALPQTVTELFEAYIALPDTLVPVLKSAKDKQSAAAAAPGLLEELKKLYGVREALQKVSSLSPRQSELVREKYEKPMRERWGAVYAEMFRLQKNRCYGSEEFSKMYKIMCLMLNK